MQRGVIFLMALLLVPLSTGAQVDAAVVSDGTGDVVISSADGSVQQPDGGQFPNVDLVEAGILAEDEETITFYVAVAGLDATSQNPVPFSDPDYRVYFNYGDQGYRVRMDTALTNALNDAMGRSGTAFGALEIQVGESSYRNHASAEVTLEYSENRVFAAVPRDAIVDENQAPLSRGRTLTGMYATSQSMGQFSFPVGQTSQGGDPLLYFGPPRAWDQAPDSISGQLPSYTMTTGEIRQRGGLVSGSEDPVRWTNGEASTLVFDVRVVNTGEKDLPVGVNVDGTDPKWTLAFSDSLTIPAGASANVTILVTIPFSHNHGAIDTFDAQFTSVDGEHYSSTMLGVYWPLVPQPAGHHDMLWFHSYQETDENNFFGPVSGSQTHSWFSALESEDLDEGIPVPAQFTVPPNPFTGGKGIAYWRIPLEPSLRMGLDFRTNDAGTLELGMQFPVTVVDPQVYAVLEHAVVEPRQGRNDNGIRDEQTLASGQSDALAGPVEGSQVFTIPLEVEEAADEIPYTLNSNLFLTVYMEATWLAGSGQSDAAAISPAFTPGNSWMQLPLNEYEAPLDITFQTDGAIELTPTLDGQQKSVNPGKVAVYAFDMVYHGSSSADFTVEITGTHADWAKVVGDGEFTLDAHGARQVGLAITAPKDARAGEFADLTFTIRDRDNAAIQAGVNTRTTVVVDQEIPDEINRAEDLTSELTTVKESPGLPLLFVLGALFVALRRRA